MTIQKLKKSDLKKAFLFAVVSLLAAGDRFLLPAIHDKKGLKAPETQVLRFFVDTLVITKANCEKKGIMNNNIIKKGVTNNPNNPNNI